MVSAAYPLLEVASSLMIDERISTADVMMTCIMFQISLDTAFQRI